MTEQEWLAGNDPQLMLDFLFEHPCYSERKMRLFAVACYWQVSEFHWDEPLFEAEINAIQQYADGLISKDDLRAISLAHYRHLFPNEEESALHIVELEADYALQTAEWAVGLARYGGRQSVPSRERRPVLAFLEGSGDTKLSSGHLRRMPLRGLARRGRCPRAGRLHPARDFRSLPGGRRACTRLLVVGPVVGANLTGVSPVCHLASICKQDSALPEPPVPKFAAMEAGSFPCASVVPLGVVDDVQGDLYHGDGRMIIRDRLHRCLVCTSARQPRSLLVGPCGRPPKAKDTQRSCSITRTNSV
jgi:hypothetical protein